MPAIVSARGRIVIPAELRRKYGLRPGSKVQLVDYGGLLALVPSLRDPVRKAAGMLKTRGSLTDALVAERRVERRRERTRAR
jgi:AbrB family looped-hinge helix DNA binding protein